MHEAHVLNDLMRRLEQLSKENGGAKIRSIRVRLGALSHFTVAHFREHFEEASPGTAAHGARLDVTLMTDIHDADAQRICLESAEIDEV